jgi:protein CpxP
VHAFGNGGHGGHRGGGFAGLKMLMQLDLTDSQKTQIRDMLPAYRAEQEVRRDALRDKRQKMRDLIEAERFDEEAVRQAFRATAPLMEDMAVSRAQFMHDLKAVLTPEQVDRFKAKHMNREKHRDEHRRVREAMLDTWLRTPAESASAQ